MTTEQFNNHTSSLEPAERESKQGFIHSFRISLIWTELVSIFRAYCLSRFVQCAPDENDRPSEQTRTS